MASAFESSILVKKQSVAGLFRPAFSDPEFFSDVMIGVKGSYTPPAPVIVYFVDQSGNNFVDQSANIFIAS
jgi:hypothetical protein